MKNHALLSMSCLTAACYAFAMQAIADDNNVDAFFSMTPAQLADIPVTIATGTPKPISQSAAVASVITAEQIKNMGATELHEVLETVPGVHAGVQDGSYDYSYSVRGIRNANNSQILILLNGTRITTPLRGTLMTGTELPIEAIERVEVIRGPGSALYGADAFAGVINIITKKADDIKGTRLGGRIGNWDTQSTWVQQGSKWESWNIASSFQYQHTGGDDGRIVRQDTQTRFDTLFGTNASHAPGALSTRYETFNGYLNLQRKYWDIGFWAFNSVNGGLRAGNAGALDYKGNFNGEQYLANIHFSTEDWFDNWELIAHSSFLYADELAKLQLFPDNTLLPIGRDGNIGTAGSSLVRFPVGVNAHVGRTAQIPAIELSAIYRGFKEHLLRFGAGFRYEEIQSVELKNFGAGVIHGMPAQIGGQLTDVTDTRWVYLPNSQRSVWSLIGQDEWNFAKDWLLTVGLRYDNYSDFGGTLNPRAALVWDINQRLTTKVLYGRAFRAPTFSELHNQNNPVALGNKQLEPETINTYEWAFDYRPLETLRTAVNVYYYEIKNLISTGFDPARSINLYQNNGNQHGFGSEFEWDWQLNEQWSFKGNYAWQHAINEITDKRVTGVPEHHIYAAAIWRFLPQWQLQPQINWVSGRTRLAHDNRPLDDYETVDLTLRGRKLLGQLDVSASLRNVFDNRYHETTPLSLLENLPMPGRSFYFEASIHF